MDIEIQSSVYLRYPNDIFYSHQEKKKELDLFQMWKRYLSSIQQKEDLALTWRIFTSLKHQTLTNEQKQVVSEWLMNPIDIQKTNCKDAYLYSRLENVCWRIWYEKKNHSMKKIESDVEDDKFWLVGQLEEFIRENFQKLERGVYEKFSNLKSKLLSANLPVPFCSKDSDLESNNDDENESDAGSLDDEKVIHDDDMVSYYSESTVYESDNEPASFSLTPQKSLLTFLLQQNSQSISSTSIKLEKENKERVKPFNMLSAIKKPEIETCPLQIQVQCSPQKVMERHQQKMPCSLTFEKPKGFEVEDRFQLW